LKTGEPMVRRIREEFHIGTRTPGKGDVVRLNYAAQIEADERESAAGRFLRPSQHSGAVFVPSEHIGNSFRA